MRDLTEQRQIQDTLRVSEQRLQLATLAAHMGTFIYYPQEDRGEPDSQMLTLFGLKPNEKLNLTGVLSSIIHTDDRERYANDVAQAINPAGNGKLDTDIRVIHPDGSVHWINIAARTHFEGEPLQAVKMPGVAVDITERKQLQQNLQDFNSRLERDVKDRTRELHENYRLLQTIYDTTLIGMAVFKPVKDEQGTISDFSIIMVNKKIERSAGRTNMAGHLYSELYPGIKQMGLFDLMVKTFETGETGTMDYHYNYDGVDRWYSTMFIKGDDLLVTTNLDITERMQAEKHLLKSEERFRMYVTASSDLIYQMSADWSQMNVLQSNNFLSDIDMPTEEWLARYIPPEEQRRVMAAINNAINAKQVFEMEHRVVLANGATGWAYSRAIPLLDKNGAILEWFGVATNITVRKVYQDERNRNYLLLKQSEDVANTGTWDYDLLTGIFSCSDGMYRLFNLEKEKEISPKIFLQYATVDYQDAAARISSHITLGDSEFEETLSVAVGETVKMLRVKATVIKNDEGHPVRVLGVNINITASRQAEEKLRQLEAEQQLEIFRVTLSTQEEERRRISESLHNGLGQLLYGIKISMNDLSPALAQLDDEAYTSARRYTEELLTDAIKESRRISHELMPMVLEEFGLKAAIDDICQQLENGVKFDCKVQLKGIKLDKYFELAVYRTVQELLLNVVKHAQATTASVAVTVNDNNMLIRVKDNGNGFNSADTVQTGIGLASIRSKANLLNGDININSAPGQGTIVEVWLAIDTGK